MPHSTRTETDIVRGTVAYGQQGTWDKDGRRVPEPKEARALSDRQQKDALPQRSPWRERAACAPHNNGGRDISHLFLPPEGTEVVPTDLGMAICRHCPVTAECGEWIWDQSAAEYTVGVWGGNDSGRLTRKQKAARGTL